MKELYDATRSVRPDLRFKNESPEKVARRLRLLEALHCLAMQENQVRRDERGESSDMRTDPEIMQRTDATDCITLPVLSEEGAMITHKPTATEGCISVEPDGGLLCTNISGGNYIQTPMRPDSSTSICPQYSPAIHTNHDHALPFFCNSSRHCSQANGLDEPSTGAWNDAHSRAYGSQEAEECGETMLVVDADYGDSMVTYCA